MSRHSLPAVWRKPRTCGSSRAAMCLRFQTITTTLTEVNRKLLMVNLGFDIAGTSHVKLFLRCYLQGQIQDFGIEGSR